MDEFNGHDFKDPLYGCQWHMRNTGVVKVIMGDGSTIEGVAGEDINVEEVWIEGIEGEGVNVAVVDSGMDFRHEDLADNVNTALNHSYTGGSIYNPESNHGTSVAGMTASVGGNKIGIRGVAPRATIYGYNLLENSTSANTTDAMTRNLSVTAVSNNSWGGNDSPGFHSASSSWEMAVEQGVTRGFGGKGIFYSWAAGNGHNEGDQSNFEEFTNYYAVTSVCSVNIQGDKAPSSEEGVNLWVCAPGSGVVTTDNTDRYLTISGTSFSTPVVSGVAALVRETNGELSWRDIKLILAASARKNDESDPGWERVGVKYGLVSERYNYNSKYGFGVVDAERAVSLARSWRPVPAMRTLTVSSDDVDQDIPDLGSTEHTLTLPDDDFFTEFVEISLRFSHSYFGDMNIALISPSGTESRLLTPEKRSFQSYNERNHRFGSAKHLGENPSGRWTLRINDVEADDSGELHSWSIKVYGHSSQSLGPGNDAGGGGGGCTVSGHSSDFSDLPGAAACLLLIPLSVAVRRKGRRNRIMRYPSKEEFQRSRQVLTGA